MDQIEPSVRDEIEGIVRETDIDRKLKMAASLCASRKSLRTIHGEGDEPLSTKPGRPKSWTVHDASEQPRRSKLSTPQGRFQLLHSLGHIELCAVELALLSVSDFPGQPIEYYRDMLQIAAEEIAHTQMLRRRLNDLGGEFGSQPVHLALWETAVQADDLAQRLVVVPRILEAKGLDVSWTMRTGLERGGDLESVRLLEVIYRDEIGHVEAGTRWYRWVCQRRGWDPELAYVKALERWITRKIPKPNREARIEAGFTELELEALERYV